MSDMGNVNQMARHSGGAGRHQRHYAMPRWQRRALYGGMSLLLATGVMWLLVHFLSWPAVAQPALEGLPSPWEPWLMRLHGLGTFVILFISGSLLTSHVIKAWPFAHRRTSGSWVLAALATLALSGYALYYFLPDLWRDAVGLAHAGTGLTCAALLAAHQRQGKG